MQELDASITPAKRGIARRFNRMYISRESEIGPIPLKSPHCVDGRKHLNKTQETRPSHLGIPGSRSV
jgi:hypothetical protein